MILWKENSFTEEFIRTQMKLREKFQGESGAEVVKNFLSMKKQNGNTKYNLLDKVNKVLDREDKLAMDLKKCHSRKRNR